MKTLTLLAVALAATVSSVQAAAQNPWTELTINSAKLGETRRVFVVTPEAYSDPRRSFAVLVILDANDRQQFAAAIANTAFLAGRQTTPPLIIVGVPNGKDRAHDLTPVARGTTATQFKTAGGASAFIDFVTDEVLPEVRKNYRTLPTTILAGHSFGGLTALHAAATRSAFKGIIAMSPSLWWNDSTTPGSYADSIARRSNTFRLFATSGEFEQDIAVTTRRFAARLDSVKPATLGFAYRHYSSDDHPMTPLHSLIDGLQFIFEPMSKLRLPLASLSPTADSAALMKAFVASRDAHIAGAQLLGFSVKTLPEDQVRQAGYIALRRLNNPKLAIWYFEHNVREYPSSANVYDNLGDGLLAAGDTTAAKAQFRKSLETARANGSVESSATAKKLADLEALPKKH